MTGVTRYKEVSEGSIKDALSSTRGDIFQTACLHGCTFREIDSFIRKSPELARHVACIEKAKSEEGYDAMSDKQFADTIAYLSRQYHLEGLNIIHEIATMAATNAAELEVKLRAATQLRGNDSHRGSGSGLEGILEELAVDYAAAAPRISQIRQTVITLSGPEDTKLLSQRVASGTEVLSLPSGGDGQTLPVSVEPIGSSPRRRRKVAAQGTLP